MVNLKNMVNSKKSIILIVAGLLIIGLAVAGYFYWNWLKSSKIKFWEGSGNVADKIIDSATRGVIPSLQTNPLEDKPDINPADKANPIKDIKINPFE